MATMKFKSHKVAVEIDMPGSKSVNSRGAKLGSGPYHNLGHTVACFQPSRPIKVFNMILAAENVRVAYKWHGSFTRTVRYAE